MATVEEDAALSGLDFVVVRCPAGCGTLVDLGPPEWHTGIPGFDRTPPKAFVGAGLRGESARHFATHRFRCPGCSKDFCGSCRTAPYHAGLTCEEHASPKCVLCDEAPQLASRGVPRADEATVSQMCAALVARGWECAGAVEKRELAQLYSRLVTACAECAIVAAREACALVLPCGHACAGVAGESAGEHLGCLREGCAHQLLHSGGPAPAYGDDAAAGGSQLACYACHEPLRRLAAIRLPCAHLIHRSCAASIIASPSGPHITFAHLNCPACRGSRKRPARAVGLDHPALRASLEPHLALRSAVVRCAKRQLRERASAAEKAQVQPGGEHDGRVLDFALEAWTFFRCERCDDVFCGGARRCVEGAGARAPAGAADGGGDTAQPTHRRLCESCASIGSLCTRGHDPSFLSWKCTYCCSVARWFCWGHTHMCDSCHTHVEAGTLRWAAGTGCALAERCPLGVSHGPHGTQFSLGCSACRP
ncbi:hypothetical protein KFE25_010559 [Diacronema lutheri]|uniref:RING-type domain-containing protein n=2 Tax=Diacronema lutheri TaxID=2081491 RepID=A0A8J5XHZ6_DIALT|nr:hypothetical protein KFE25_010559 [Diacronema lutheri]